MNVDRIESYVAVAAGILVTLLAESLLLQQQVLFGVFTYSLMLLSLILYGAYEWEHPQRHLLVFAIPAIIRLLDFSLPLGSLSPLFAQLVIAVPLTLSGVVFVWIFKQAEFKLEFRWRQLPQYLLMVILGSAAGVMLFQLKQPLRWIWDSPLALGFYIFVVIFAMAFLEEWLFRGIMQTALTNFLGKGLASLVVALIYTILHINQGTSLFIMAVFIFALGLSWLRAHSNDLLNVCLVHSAANILFFLILPIYR